MTKFLPAALLIFTLTSFLRAAEPTPEQFRALCAVAQDMDHTTTGEAYEEQFTEAITKDMQRTLQSCAARSKPPYEVNLVFVIAADGKVEHIFADPGQPVSACVAGKLDRERVPPPPKADWLLLVNINIKQ
jgi:hypothetical protein